MELTMVNGGWLLVSTTVLDMGFDVSKLFSEEEAVSVFFENDSFCGVTTYGTDQKNTTVIMEKEVPV